MFEYFFSHSNNKYRRMSYEFHSPTTSTWLFFHVTLLSLPIRQMSETKTSLGLENEECMRHERWWKNIEKWAGYNTLINHWCWITTDSSSPNECFMSPLTSLNHEEGERERRMKENSFPISSATVYTRGTQLHAHTPRSCESLKARNVECHLRKAAQMP